VDFGLVKTLNATDEGLTQKSGIMARPDYIAREMALGGRNAGARAILSEWVAWPIGLTASVFLKQESGSHDAGACSGGHRCPLAERAGHGGSGGAEQIVMRA